MEPVTDAPILASRQEGELVDLARTDPDAFAELYRRHVTGIYAFALRRTRSRQLAEDVSAATFERALRGLGRFDPRRGRGFGPWLCRIAANELADRYRAGGPPRDSAGEDPVLDALGTLPPRSQEVVSLRYLAGLDAVEAGAALAMPKARLALVARGAVGRLRKALRSARPDDPIGATGRAALRRQLEDAGRVEVGPPDRSFEQWLDQHLRTHRDQVELVEATTPTRRRHPAWWAAGVAAVVVAVVALVATRGDDSPTASVSSTVGPSTSGPGPVTSAPPGTSVVPGTSVPTAVRTLAGDATILGGTRVRLRWVAYPDPDFASYVLVRGRVGARPQYPPAGTDVVVATINDRTATTFVDSVRIVGGQDPVYLVVAVGFDGRVVGRSAAIRARLR